MATPSPIRNVLTLAYLLMALMGFVAITYPALQQAMIIYLFVVGISIFVYSRKDLQGSLEGISGKNFVTCLIYGSGLGIIYYVISVVVPGLSIGIPILPQSIGTGLRAFVVQFVAPVAETVLVQGAVFGFLIDRFSKHKVWAILGQAGFFVLLHISAYVSGFYNYADVTSGFLALLSNIGAFIPAFVFASIAGFLMVEKKKLDLSFVIILHAIINIIIYQSLTIVFVG